MNRYQKIVNFFIIAILVAVVLCQAAFAEKEIGAEFIAETIKKAAPAEFGYSDNTEYYMQYYFSALSYVDDCCVFVCTQSTNFNEFGVFHVKTEADARHCATQLKSYITKAKDRFKSGVIYDIEQYPKFENARVTVIGQYVIYTILDSSQTKSVLKTVKSLLA